MIFQITLCETIVLNVNNPLQPGVAFLYPLKTSNPKDCKHLPLTVYNQKFSRQWYQRIHQ